MSGIAGIYRLDGAPTNEADIDRMAHSLAHRGPDGIQVWREGSVALAHQMLRTTPESRGESLPLVNPAGNLVLTADARIDNRDELLSLLAATNFAGRPPNTISDSSLILAAYEKWGERCPEHLLGDFAFAIWDARNRTLFCARDHMGIKPFYFYHVGGLFAFGSEVKALWCLPDIPHGVNELHIANFLFQNYQDVTAGFYSGINRIAPAHWMIVSEAGTRSQKYWTLDPDRRIRLGSDAEYAAGFRELFLEAVRCRLRADVPVGSMLSGGLDSSAVTCAARDLRASNLTSRLSTFSAYFPSVPQCDEKAFIDIVLAQGGLQPFGIQADQISPLVDLDRMLWHLEEPHGAPNLFISWSLYALAKDQGVRVMLDGLDGDTVVSHGQAYLSELMYRGDWAALAVQVGLLAEPYRKTDVAKRFFIENALKDVLPELARQGKLPRLVAAINQFAKTYGISRRHLLEDEIIPALANRLPTRFWRSQTTERMVNHQFVRDIDYRHNHTAWRRYKLTPILNAEAEHYRQVTSGLLATANELTDKSAAAFGIEARHPFFDMRLVEYCYGLPTEQKISGAYTRMVMRRGLTGILPAEIQWRTRKSNLTPNFLRSFLAFEQGRIEHTLQNVALTGKYMALSPLRDAYARYRAKPIESDAMTLWHAVMLEQWLTALN